MAEMKKYGAASIGHESLSDAERPSDNLEIDEIMAKLEQGSRTRTVLICEQETPM